MDRNVRYREILAKQLVMNPETWQALQSHGVTEESQVRLDFSYLCPDRARAEELRLLLADQTDYDLEVQSEGGAFRKRWAVVGRTQPTTISAAILDLWVDWMVTAGLQHECEFDGWGAEV